MKIIIDRLTLTDLFSVLHVNVSKESQLVPSVIKRKMSQKKRLVTKLRQNPNEMMKRRVRNLNTEIKGHFVETKRNRVRKGIIGLAQSELNCFQIKSKINISDKLIVNKRSK